jgi:hypothetical protein
MHINSSSVRKIIKSNTDGVDDTDAHGSVKIRPICVSVFLVARAAPFHMRLHPRDAILGVYLRFFGF